MQKPLLRSVLTHPVVIAAVVLLLLNDHVLKTTWPSWATGKLSDIAGLVFFPLLLAAVLELAFPHQSPSRLIADCIIATGVVFTAVQLAPVATNTYEVVWGAMQWPFRLALDPDASLHRVTVTPDWTDLLALPALLLAQRIAANGIATQPAGQPRSSEDPLVAGTPVPAKTRGVGARSPS